MHSMKDINYRNWAEMVYVDFCDPRRLSHDTSRSCNGGFHGETYPNP